MIDIQIIELDQTPYQTALMFSAALNHQGYPYVAATAYHSGEFARMEVWDDHREIMRVIVCCHTDEIAAAWAYGDAVAMACEWDMAVHVYDVDRRVWTDDSGERVQ